MADSSYPGIVLGLPLSPGNANNYTHDAKFGKGGWVGLTASEFYGDSSYPGNGVSKMRLEEGMVVTIVGTTERYQYINGKWSEFKISGDTSIDLTSVDVSYVDTYYVSSAKGTEITVPSNMNSYFQFSETNPGVGGAGYRQCVHPNEFAIAFGSQYSTNWKDNLDFSWTAAQSIYRIQKFIYKSNSIFWTNFGKSLVSESAENSISRSVSAYKVSDIKPSLPSDGSMILPPTNWSSECPDGSGDVSVWQISAVVRTSDSSTISEFVSPWSGPLKLNGGNGRNGEDGISYEYIYALTKSVTDVPSVIADSVHEQNTDWPTNATDTSTAFHSTTYTTKWTDNPSGVTSEYLYEWIAVRDKTNGLWNSFSTPAVFSKYGEDGKDADGLEYIYKVTDSSVALSLTEPYLKNGNNVLSTDSTYLADDFVPDGWNDSPQSVSSSKRFQFMSCRKKADDAWQKFTTPALWSVYGDKGDAGDPGNNYKFLVINSEANVSAIGKLSIVIQLKAIKNSDTGTVTVIDPITDVDIAAVVCNALGNPITESSGLFDNYSFTVSSETDEIRLIATQCDTSTANGNRVRWNTLADSSRIESVTVNMYVDGKSGDASSLMESYTVPVSMTSGSIFTVVDNAITSAVQEASTNTASYVQQTSSKITAQIDDVSNNLHSEITEMPGQIWNMVDTSLGKSGIHISGSGVSIVGNMYSDASVDGVSGLPSWYTSLYGTSGNNVPLWYLAKTGQGWLGNGAIQWDNTGNVTLGSAFTTAISSEVSTQTESIRKLNSITSYYLASASASGVTRSTSGWTTDSTAAVITSTLKYLWTYQQYTWSSGTTTTYTDPVVSGVYGDAGASGADGAKGDKGDTGASGADGKDGTNGSNGKDGSDAETYMLVDTGSYARVSVGQTVTISASAQIYHIKGSTQTLSSDTTHSYTIVLNGATLYTGSTSTGVISWTGSTTFSRSATNVLSINLAS